MQIHPRPLATAIALLALTASSTAIAGVTPSQIAKLLPDGVVPEDEFATSLDLEGDIAVVGAPFDDELGANAGAVYVYRKTEGVWALETKLLASDGAVEDEFGRGVAISGNRIVITAPSSESETISGGSVYTYEWDGQSWSEIDQLFPATTDGVILIGTTVALDGDTLVVPIRLYVASETSPASATVIYHRDGATWAPAFTITEPRLQYFRDGPVVAICGDVATIGAFKYDDGVDIKRIGAVRILRRNNGVWAEETMLRGSKTLPSEQFGWSIDIDGDTIIIGSDESLSFYHRTVYVYRWDGLDWTSEAHLMAGDEASVEPTPNDDVFGFEVAIHGDVAIVHDRIDTDTESDEQFRGATYIFKRTGTEWTLLRHYIIDGGENFEKFGNQIALDGVTALIGNNGATPTTSAAFLINLCATDINADGLTDPADLGMLIGSFGNTTGGPTDLNGDGVTDTADLGMLIGQFGTPCP